MGDLAKPKEMKTPRNRADDTFAQMLQGALKGQGGNLPAFIAQNFTLPKYDGDMTAGMTAGQSAAQGQGQAAGVAGANAMADFFAPGGGNANITSALSKIMNDSGVGGPGVNTSDITAVSDVGMPTADSLYKSLDPVRQASMARDLGQMEEQFGVNGLAGSTSLYESGARAQTESQQGLLAEVAKMMPELANAQTARLGVGTDRMNAMTGRLNTGVAMDQIKRSGALDAAKLMGDIPMGVATAGMDLAKSGFELGEGERSIADLDLQRQYADFVRSNALWPQLLAYLSGTPQPAYGPSDLAAASQAAGTIAAGAGLAGA